jgi:hypothetical protein
MLLAGLSLPASTGSEAVIGLMNNSPGWFERGAAGRIEFCQADTLAQGSRALLHQRRVGYDNQLGVGTRLLG